MSDQPIAAASLPSPGDVIAGKYRIEKLIGKGGMGAVFAAQHEILFQKVAVKVLLGEVAASQEAVQRFLNEARNAARIQGEHICRVTDCGSDNGLPFMVLEYMEGQDLSQLLETRGRVAVEDAVDYVLQSLEAIHQAHTMGIVHRDLKPSNLFLHRRPDGGFTVKVLDFGISKAQNTLGPGSGALTSTKAMLGSPLYMSPEQLRSSKSVDARADIWALGVILYELISGAVPYTGDNLGELFAAILETDPVPLRSRVPEVSPGLEAVIMNCLQRRADQRVPSVQELARALAPFAPPQSQTLALVMGARASGPSPYAAASGQREGASTGQFAGASQTGPGLPARGASTVSAVNVPVPPPRMTPQPQYGATTPMPGLMQVPPIGASTGSGMRSIDLPPTPPTSKAPLAFIAVGAFIVIGCVIGGGAYLKFGGHRTTEAATSAAPPLPTMPEIPTAPATVASVAPASSQAEPPAGSAGAPTGSAASAAGDTVATNHGGHGGHAMGNNDPVPPGTKVVPPTTGGGAVAVVQPTPPPVQVTTQPTPPPTPKVTPPTQPTGAPKADPFAGNH